MHVSNFKLSELLIFEHQLLMKSEHEETMYRKVVRRPEHLQKNLGFHELSIGQHEGRFGRHKLQSSVAQIRCVCDH